jgi:hypothetical protein
MLTFRISTVGAAITVMLALGAPAQACDDRYPTTCRSTPATEPAPNVFNLFAKWFGGKSKARQPTTARTRKAHAGKRRRTRVAQPAAIEPAPPIAAAKRAQHALPTRPHVIKVAGQSVRVVSPDELNEIDLAAGPNPPRRAAR